MPAKTTNEQWVDFMKESIASRDRQIGELTHRMGDLTGRITAQTANIDKLVTVTNENAIAIRTLARIVVEGGDAR